MTLPIGYYVHHHGEGHRQRALQIASCAPDRFVLLGTGLAGRTGEVAHVELEDDRPEGQTIFDGRDGTPHRPAALHYAPTHHPGVRARVARMTAWMAQARPALMVVDVSVEVAMLARLAATPTVCVRLTGHRDDPAHMDAFRGATGLLCPFGEALDDPAVDHWIRAKTRYAPGLTSAPASRPVRQSVVLVVAGRGGQAWDGDRIAEAARAHPERLWRVAGPVSPVDDPPDNLTLLGWTQAVPEEIAGAGVVVGGAGNGLVNAVMATDRPFICLPEPRPYGEQGCTGRGLARMGAAVVVEGGWPPAEAWAGLLEGAAELDPHARRGLADPFGAETTARWILELADRRLSAAAVPSAASRLETV